MEQNRGAVFGNPVYYNMKINLQIWQLLGRLLVRVLLPGVRDGLVLRLLLVSFLPRLSGQV